MEQYLIRQQCCTLAHAPRRAARAKAAALAAEGHQLLGMTGLAAQPREAMFQPAGLQVLFELALHVARQATPGGTELRDKVWATC